MARVSSQEGLLAEFPHPAGRVLFAAAENSRRGPIEDLDADFVPLYSHTSAHAGPASRRRRRARFRLRRAGLRGDRRKRARGSIGPQTSYVAASVGLNVVSEAQTHDLDGLVAAVDAVASGP